MSNSSLNHPSFTLHLQFLVLELLLVVTPQNASIEK